MRGELIGTSVNERNLVALVEASPDGILLLDFEGRVQFASRRVVAMLRLMPSDPLIMRSVFDFIMPRDRASVAALLESVRTGARRDLHELRVVCSDQTVLWTEWNVELFVSPGARDSGVLVIIRDADRRKRSERALLAAKQNAEAEIRRLQSTVSELQLAAWTDKLTGVGNRRQFELIADAEIAQTRQYGLPVSLVLVDVDYFKRINDRHGHQTGDEVLVKIVRTMLDSMRSGDTLCRWGGEEFVVLAPGTTASLALRIADRLRMRVEESNICDAERITISAGVAEFDQEEDAEAWMNRADRALYAAKRAGRNRCELAQPGTEPTNPRLFRLIWRSSFDCGDPLIDHQHRELFSLGNALLDQIFAHPQPGKLQENIGALLATLERHFYDEEALLERIGYPGREDHRQLHALLLREAKDVPERAKEGETALPTLLDFLVRRVIFDHVIHADQEFAPFVSQSASHAASPLVTESPPASVAPQSKVSRAAS